MILKYFSCLFLMVFICSGAGAKPRHREVKLIEAYSQRTLAGMPGTPPSTVYRFIIVWTGKKPPESFFWLGDRGWQACGVDKAHKVMEGQQNIPRGMNYQVELIEANKVRKGDTLQLTPIAGSITAAPKEVDGNKKRTLFYKTSGSGWIAFPVTNITKKPDIAMP